MPVHPPRASRSPSLGPCLRLPLFLRRPPPPPPAAAPDLAAIAGPDLDPLPTCGWFDSSHDLQAGLQVTEHDSPDAVAADLPLAHWLAMHLAGAQRPPPAAR